MYMHTVTVWRKCLTGENFDEFDESKLHRKNFPYQYYTFQKNNLSASTCNIYGSLAVTQECTDRY